MKKPDKIIFERYLYKLSLDELRAYIQKYDERNKTKAYQEITKVKQTEIQTKIEALYPNITCPYCKSDHYIKYGFYDGFQRYLCKNCNSSFTLVTDTFMEGTNWTWEVWVKLLQMTLCSMSLDEMIDTLEKDYKLLGISRNTVFLARHKLLHAMSLMPKPTLTGIVQVDETFFRENQKGTRTDLGKKLINVIPNIVPIRLPRRGYSPSRLGTMGTEYATAVCAVDNHNHAVTVVAGFGKVDPKVFTDCFDNHFADITYLCTDGSPIYKDYCVLKSIPHYVKPANFVKYLLQKGYISGVSSKSEDEQIRELYLNNKRIAAELYADGLLDYIETANSMPFNEFCKIKYEYGLNLSRVNAFHNYLKLHLERIMTGVATKYLPTYVDAYTFMYNWKHDHKTTLSSMKDAEIILVELIKNKTAFTLNDLKQKDFFIAPQPTGRYIALLTQATREMRRVTDNKFFKFDENDRIISFDQRKYIKETPKGKLKEIAKEYKIKNYTSMTHWQLYSAIMDLPKAERTKIIQKLIANDKVYNIYTEDIKFITAHELSSDDLTYSKGGNLVDLDRLFIIEKED